LDDLVANQILPGTGVGTASFWRSFAEILNDLTPRNKALLAEREELQCKIDAWHRERQGQFINADEYQSFLADIGYLVPEGENFTISTTNVDDEVAVMAGPQLVVPVMNARYALNAANARWGSLYDALYGTDVIPEDDGCEKGKSYNPKRGNQVIAWAANFLDEHAPLAEGSHGEVSAYGLADANGQKTLTATLSSGARTGLADLSQFVGYLGGGNPSNVLLRHNGLHIDIQIDRGHSVGKDNPSGVKDVMLEAALTTIQDCEDSIAAVDAEDKTLVYANWLGLMKGDLVDGFEKDGRKVERRLNPDRIFAAPNGEEITLHGRSLLLVRVQTALHFTPVFFETINQIALHQTKPVGIDQCLVLSIHGGDRILAILNGSKGRFQHDVLDAGGIILTHGMASINLDIDVQAVVAQQNVARVSTSKVANELTKIRQTSPGARRKGRCQCLLSIGIRQTVCRNFTM
jgi:malate synthase